MDDRRVSSHGHAQRLAEGVYEDALLDRCRFLSTVGFWAGSVAVQPEAWLSNFRDEESRRHALYLLSALQYYNADLCEALTFAGLRMVAKRWSAMTPENLTHYLDRWRYVTGSMRIYVPASAAPAFLAAVQNAVTRSGLSLALTPVDRPPANQGEYSVLIVDCVGPMPSDEILAFSLHRDPATTCLLALLQPAWSNAPHRVSVVAVHEVPPLYSITRPDSVVWPAELQESGPQFVLRTRLALGLSPPSEDLAQTAITFGHRVPEIVDPILTHASADYEPLLVSPS
jgi:hypothetical protein